jgi:hypothetical protein
MNLVRLGHRFQPTSAAEEELAGLCETALVVGVNETQDGEQVNLVVWDNIGHETLPLHVAVAEPSAGQVSFHLSGDCPWKR